MVSDAKHVGLVIMPMTSLLANQHVASESDMCVNVHVICVKLRFWLFSCVSRNLVDFIAAYSIVVSA